MNPTPVEVTPAKEKMTIISVPPNCDVMVPAMVNIVPLLRFCTKANTEGNRQIVDPTVVQSLTMDIEKDMLK